MRHTNLNESTDINNALNPKTDAFGFSLLILQKEHSHFLELKEYVHRSFLLISPFTSQILTKL